MGKDRKNGNGGRKSQDTDGAHKFDPVTNDPQIDHKRPPESGPTP